MTEEILIIRLTKAFQPLGTATLSGDVHGEKRHVIQISIRI